MARESGRRASSTPLLMMTLSAAAGTLLTLVFGGLVLNADFAGVRNAKSGARPCERDERVEAAEASRREAQVMDQNAELRRALVAALARSYACEGAPSPSDSRLLSEQSPEPEPAPLPSSPQNTTQEEAEVVSLQSELSREAVDPAWAPHTEQATERAIAATGSMQVQEVTCRQTLCRVAVTHSDLAKREEDVEKLLGSTLGAGQARVYAPSNEPTTVMYFSREGTLLSVL